jgi:hypothetical protein
MIYRASNPKFIAARFILKPAALIGAQPQGLHCTANMGLMGLSAVKARWAYSGAFFLECFGPLTQVNPAQPAMQLIVFTHQVT